MTGDPPFDSPGWAWNEANGWTFDRSEYNRAMAITGGPMKEDHDDLKSNRHLSAGQAVEPSTAHTAEQWLSSLDAQVEKNKGGVKHDQAKDPWQLFPWDAARAIVKVLKFGATKYAARNWEQGMDWDRMFRATINHLTKWWDNVDEGKGPGIDPDTGESHLWNAGCCILFLISYELRGVGRDNRPGTGRPPSEARG